MPFTPNQSLSEEEQRTIYNIFRARRLASDERDTPLCARLAAEFGYSQSSFRKYGANPYNAELSENISAKPADARTTRLPVWRTDAVSDSVLERARIAKGKADVVESDLILEIGGKPAGEFFAEFVEQFDNSFNPHLRRNGDEIQMLFERVILRDGVSIHISAETEMKSRYLPTTATG